MTRRHVLARGLARLLPVLAFLGLAAASPARASGADDYPVDEVLIRLTSGGSLPMLLATWDATVVDSIPSRRLYLLHLNSPALQDSMTVDLDGDTDSRYCDYNFANQTPEARRQIVVIAIGDSTLVRDQGAFTRVRLPLALTVTQGTGSKVALLDTGADLTHPFFAGTLVPGHDYIDGDDAPQDDANGLDDNLDGQVDGGAGHGTMVAGIVHSIAPAATLMPIRVLDDEGIGSVFAIMKGLYEAIDAQATVINLSLGMSGKSEGIEDAIEEAYEKGIFVIAAAGNDSMPVLEFPARGTHAFSVTATDSLDVKAPFANYSSGANLCAPGLGIYSAYRDGGFAQGAGTSFAAPFVAGTAALLHAFAPARTSDEIAAAIEQSAVAVDALPGNTAFAGQLGSGRLDVYGALTMFGATSAVAGERHETEAHGFACEAIAGPWVRDALRFRITSDRTAPAECRVLDVRGRTVVRRSLGLLSAATSSVHTVPLRDAGDRLVPSGVYTWIIDDGVSRARGRAVVIR